MHTEMWLGGHMVFQKFMEASNISLLTFQKSWGGGGGARALLKKGGGGGGEREMPPPPLTLKCSHTYAYTMPDGIFI